MTHKKGFTIVELLIVIVVIAILAAITIVSYNGIQSQAENTKTITAVSAWAKAIQLYKADTGAYPSENSCLGSTTTYQGYSGRCWAPDTSPWVVRTAFLNLMSPYMSSTPEPSTVNIGSSTSQYRGAVYYYDTAGARYQINVNFVNTSSCPAIGGLDPSFSGANRDSGRSCYYRLPE